jgi:anthranilate phosphoribosyltransferase
VRAVAKVDLAPPEVADVFHRLNVRAPVDVRLLATAFGRILRIEDSHLRDLLLSAFLMSVMTKGPQVEEIVALLREAFTIDGFSPDGGVKVNLPPNEKLIGCAGSGKKGVKTINVSTPSALLAAAIGVYVVKTGSSSTSSISGSADFLTAIGANIRPSRDEMVATLRKLRFGFVQIEALVPNFDRLYGGRFFVPHALSFGLAGLITPVKLDHRLYGLSHPEVELPLRVFREFGVKNALVVSSTHDDIHYIDEMGIYGTTRVIGMRGGRIGRLLYVDPAAILRIARYRPEDLAQGCSLEENVAIALSALRGRGRRAFRDIICINAANLMVLSEKAEDLRQGFALAKRAMAKGTALDLLESFVASTGGDVAALHARL